MADITDLIAAINRRNQGFRPNFGIGFNFPGTGGLGDFGGGLGSIGGAPGVPGLAGGDTTAGTSGGEPFPGSMHGSVSGPSNNPIGAPSLQPGQQGPPPAQHPSLPWQPPGPKVYGPGQHMAWVNTPQGPVWQSVPNDPTPAGYRALPNAGTGYHLSPAMHRQAVSPQPQAAEPDINALIASVAQALQQRHAQTYPNRPTHAVAKGK